MDIKKLLSDLCAIEAPSGREITDEDNLKSIVLPYFDKYEKLECNSYLFTKSSKVENAPNFLLDAHFDQIGMIVTSVSEEGFLKFISLGGLDVRTLISSKVNVLGYNKTISGIICSKKTYSTPIKLDDLYIETDLTKNELEEAGITVGTTATLFSDKPFINDELYVDRSLDNRSSAAVIMYAVSLLANKELSCNVCMLLSSQEESQGAGAKTGTFKVDPEKAIVVDVDFGATPETDKKDTVELSKGPTIPVSVQCDRKMTKKLIAIAKEKEIPAHPILNPTSTGTNASHVPFGIGVPTAVIGLPLKNMHTVYETVDIRDIEFSGKLIAEYLISEYGI